MKKSINIWMDETLLTDLDAYAQELAHSRTYIIEKAVISYFDTLDEMISDKRIDELKAGKSEVYSLEELKRSMMKTITAKEFDEKFDNGKDVSEYLDFSKAKKLKNIQKK